MVKFLSVFLFVIYVEASELEKFCLDCHIKDQIPSELIYKRYLLKYSSKDKIEDKIFGYLKDPKQKDSIMPKPFFLKFPMKKRLPYSDKTLKKLIEKYIEKYDVKKRLKLKYK